MKTTVLCAVLAACGAVWGQAAPATSAVGGTCGWQQEMWERPVSMCTGVTLRAYALDEPRLMKAFVARIDLGAPGVGFTATDRDAKWGEPMTDYTNRTVLIDTKRETTPAFMMRRRAAGEPVVLAVNASPWGPWDCSAAYRSKYGSFRGWNVSHGVELSQPGKPRKGPLFVVYKDGRADVVSSVSKSRAKDVEFAFRGFGLVMTNGVPTAYARRVEPKLSPRTVFGLDAGRKTLVLLVVDGRQPGYSVGAQGMDLYEILRREGVTDAVGMDGGGSSTLTVFDAERGKPLTINRPSDRRPRRNALNVGILLRDAAGSAKRPCPGPDGSPSAQCDIPLPEHPRPDWERSQWVNLNGQWDFGFEAGKYDRKITVPFGWGSALSGVKDEKGRDTGYYHRKVKVPQEWKGSRVFLVVGAADYNTEFSFNGKPLGKHVGGYTPFEFEITDFVKWGEEQTAEFKIWDPDFVTAHNGHYLFGKQGYGNVRGIWQTVYLEARGKDYIDSARFTPSIAKSSVRAELRLAAPAGAPLVAEVKLDGKTTRVPFAKGESAKSVDIAVDSPRMWDLDSPNLYDVELALGDDAVRSYFGFREVGVGKNANGDAYVTLNGKPIYLQMCLDQSYHPHGYYTFPTDECMKNEIMISKKLALSGNRVHIKVEVPRKLYWADRLGLLIQADVPNAWGEPTDAMFNEHWACFEEMVKRDFNHPSIYQWTLFNETWGLLTHEPGKKRQYLPETQRRVGEAYRKAKALDPTRLIDDNSVCLRDHVETDVNTWHRYCPAYEWYSKLERVCTNTYAGSKCNYAAGRVQDGAPMMNAECGNVWGYKDSTGDCDFTWDYHAMINAFRSHLKCGGWLYTEHHDVIIEWNGYVRDDRTWKETGLEEVAGMTLADFHGKAALFMMKRRGYETGEVVQPGEKVVIPVGVSFVTDEFAGRKLTLSRSAWWFDGAGRKRVSDAVSVGGSFAAKSWQCEKLWDVEFVAPGGPACGCVVFDLMADGKRIARDFWSFSTVAPDAAMPRPKASEWSEGTAEVMGGLKLNGFGKGWFEYEVAVPPQGGMFRAELSAKRRNWKDREGEGLQLDYPTGKRTMERSKNQNSYPQTSAEKFPANLTVRVGGKVALELVLPDDPADHRGLLSWLAQPHDKRLREAGSYGWLVEVKVPPEAVKDGKAAIRLESDAGLAVYGPRFGRYPLGPSVCSD